MKPETKKTLFFFAFFLAIAGTISMFGTRQYDAKYAYLTGSLLFTIPTVWFFFARRDMIKLMLLCGLAGIPFGLLTEYFFYTKDWWTPETITGTRIGIEDIFYSFFHGSLLSTTGLLLTNRKITLDAGAYKRMALGVAKIGLAVIIVGLIAVFAFKMPSFIATTFIFAGVGGLIVVTCPDLLKLGLVGMIGTLGWCVPVFWINNSLFPGWIQSFWINNTNKVLILEIPLPDLLWYMSVGLAAAVLPDYLIRKKN